MMRHFEPKSFGMLVRQVKLRDDEIVCISFHALDYDSEQKTSADKIFAKLNRWYDNSHP